MTAEFLQHGRVRRRQLGIAANVVQIARGTVVDLDLVSNVAVQVVDIDSRGIAYRCGVREGDLIISVNDRIVENVDDLHRFLTRIPIDTELELSIIREGQLRQFVLTQK